jgi:hypothetical protein
MKKDEIIMELNGISDYMELKETTIGLGQINDLIEKLKQVKNCSIPDVSESLLRETIYLLSIKQPDSCPNWIEGVGDCNKPECEFCRIQRCIDELESNVR